MGGGGMFIMHLTNKLNNIIETVLGAVDFLLPLHVKFMMLSLHEEGDEIW
jgi:hypothetical protein